MNRCYRSLLSAAVVAGLCGGVSLVRAGAPIDAPSARPLDHWKFEHMHHALDSRREARHELDIAADIFHGHKAEALDHVDQAIRNTEEGLREQHDYAAMPAELPRPIHLAEKYEHIHRAIELLHQARAELDSAEHVFGSHRDQAIDHTDHALHQLEDAIRDAER